MNRNHLVRTVLAVISMACVAQADIVSGHAGQYHLGHNQPLQPYDPSPYDPIPGQGQDGWDHSDQGGLAGSTRQTLSAWVQRNVTNERISLRQLLQLDRQWNGWQVVAVRATTRPNNPGRTVAQLVVDGRIVAAQNNPGYQINLAPSNLLILGSSARELQLVLSGSTFIEDIQLDLVRTQSAPLPQPGYPQPLPPQYPGQPHEPVPYPQPPSYPGNPGYGQQRIDIPVYRQLFGNDRVDLTQYINLQSYLGMRVDSVVIQASATQNTSFVSFLVNGNNRGQVAFTGAYSVAQTIWLNPAPVIGRGADSLVLYSSGQMNLERVTLVLGR